MTKNQFFIGWQEKVPESSKKAILRMLLIFTSIAVSIIAVFVLNQSRFNDYFFQFGKIQHVTGTYHSSPVPILSVADNSLDPGIGGDMLLVGYGKSGAEGIMENIEKKLGNLEGKTIKVQGSMIHGDGKTVFELTKKSESVLDVLSAGSMVLEVQVEKAQVTLEGEIIDPKCYFGVMKPGEGKIHKSCAIRCISGGIPPVLKVKKEIGNEYYIITGKDGLKINKEILDFIAEPVKIMGNTYSLNGWNILEIDPIHLVLR